MFYHLLYPLHEQIILFNVFRYISFRSIAATLTAMLIGFIMGPWFISSMTKRQVGQQVRDEGPSSHLSKAGTPTMGGVVILAAVIISTLLWSQLNNALVWIAVLVTFSYGMIGFIDDYLKLKHKNSSGISGKTRLFLESAIILALLWWSQDKAFFSSYVAVPFFKDLLIPLGSFYILFGAVVVVGSANAVNLTDGLDGLAIGPVMICAVSLLIFAYVAGHIKLADYLQIPYIIGSGELCIFCGAMFGASLSFLWYNTYPAQVFMGDIGSLSLGGAIGIVALLTKNELVLVILGGIFVIEALSVITQVVSFQLTGKRIFKMAPIHHHFELKGWAEPKVIVRFWIISIILALISLSTLKLR